MTRPLPRKDLLYDAIVCIAQGRPWAGYADPRNIAEQALAEQSEPMETRPRPGEIVDYMGGRWIVVESRTAADEEPSPQILIVPLAWDHRVIIDADSPELRRS